jgi:putative transcriptional regulator
MTDKLMTLVNQIKEIRLDHNITQEQLAESVGVSRQTIIAIEKGNYTPSLSLAMQLAKFFKTTIENLFTFK